MAAEESSFGALLSRYRLAARLTQEELAERAALSARAISDLERGVRSRPQPLTVLQLADALEISSHDRSQFEAAARLPTKVAPGALQSATQLPIGNFLGAVPAGILVARDDEMRRVQTMLDVVAAGAGQVLVLAGELGAGKTRLMQEMMLAARSRGFAVGIGRYYQGEQVTPYTAMLDALDGAASFLPAAPHAEDRRLQELRQVMHQEWVVDDARADGIEQQQFIAAVTKYLVLLAETSPVAVLLDDLHWADDGSITLLHHLARATRGCRVLLVGTSRDEQLGDARPMLTRTLRDLSRERLLERISLRRLAPEETSLLVASLMGQAPVSEEFAAFVHRRGKGNPRFIDQLVRALGGRLQLRREIGAGAMGRVFEALDSTTNEIVAAKLLLSRGEIPLVDLLRFQREGAVLAALSHPNIVRIHDAFVEEHACCIIMELLDGPTLGRLLCDGPLPLPRARCLALQVAAALAYAHGQGIAHRDIKPDNIMVVGEDQVKVTDFGIARLLQPDTSLQTIATTGMRLGTPLYMAPEQIAGKKVDGRTDLYALGAVLYHMVTGRPPFDGGDALAVAVRHLHEAPPLPRAIVPSIPAEWEALILKALEKDPARRFQSAREMEQAIAALGVVARPPTGMSRRTPMLSLAAGLLLAALASAFAVWMHARAGTPLLSARPIASGALAGTYSRTFDDADLRAAHDPNLAGWVGSVLTITINKGWIHFALPNSATIDEYVTFTTDGRLTLFRYLPTTMIGFCSINTYQTPPTGYYRWSFQARVLTISLVKDARCIDRPGIVPGRWVKIS